MEEYVFLTEKNFSRLKAEIAKIRNKNPASRIVFSSEDDELNRQVLEKAKIDLLLLPLLQRRDFSKQRNSGFNMVLANIAKKNKIEIGIDLDELNSESKKIKSEILARIIQNIALCKKKKIMMKFISKKGKMNEYLVKSLGSSLGMPPWMTKNI
ncbi:MAG: hypothetical protein ABIH28_03065 [archaeon]